MMMGFGGFGLLLMFLLFILVIGAAVALVSLIFPRPANPDHSAQRYQSQPAEDSALAILKQRYARGDLTREEYETMKQDILAN